MMTKMMMTTVMMMIVMMMTLALMSAVFFGNLWVDQDSKLLEETWVLLDSLDLLSLALEMQPSNNCCHLPVNHLQVMITTHLEVIICWRRFPEDCSPC